ncbi:MAG: hypothetical protein IJV16_06565 [Lachnospiraceae bacterium]|nr:hypothetical protein [Lachnospiraceae bacterium]
MKDLIKADMARILRTKLIYVCLVFILFRLMDQIFQQMNKEGFGAKAYIEGVHNALGGQIYGALYLVIPVFIAVYSNEIPAKAMQCMLGHGLKRDELIMAKLIDAALLLAGYFVIISALLLILNDDSVAMSDMQNRNMAIYILFTYIRFYGYIVFSAMVMFLTNSAAAGIVTCVAFTAILKLTFTVLNVFTDFTIYDYTFDGQLDLSYGLIEAGRFGWQIIPALIYLIAGVVITIVFFRRKEFEF